MPAGAWKPDPAAFGKFAQAVAKRYSGHFRGLPRVKYFEAWNEPNLTFYLAPQWVGKKKKSPDLYRRLLTSFYAAVHAAQPKATVIGGAMSPFGDSRAHPLIPKLPRMRPLAFLRGLLCLNGKLKRTKKCSPKPHLDVASQHPINGGYAPHYSAQSKDDVVVADFHRVRETLRAAERAGVIRPRGRHALWATETGLISDPPNPHGIPVQKHARWLEDSLYLLWKQGARVVINLRIRDPASTRVVGATGVFFHDGKPKPAFQAFRFPFVTDRKSKKKVGAWGKSPSSGTLKIQKQRHGHWKTLKKLKTHTGRVFNTKLRLRGKAKLRAKVGHDTSLTWRQKG